MGADPPFLRPFQTHPEVSQMEDKIHQVDAGDEFKVCPHCGYEDGFHSMFQKEGGATKWLFICPSCHQVFDVGLTVGG